MFTTISGDYPIVDEKESYLKEGGPSVIGMSGSIGSRSDSS
jgi:hypothetical protein